MLCRCSVLRSCFVLRSKSASQNSMKRALQAAVRRSNVERSTEHGARRTTDDSSHNSPMPGSMIHARPPAGAPRIPRIERDPDLLAGRLQDAAHFPGGHATELAYPTSEAEIAALLRRSSAVLPIGAQSSLTGGATPMGEVVVSTGRLNRIEAIGQTSVRVQAGVTLTELDRALERAGRYYPPAPTFFGAFVGGTAATNAAGAATFKYGTTRDWVQALTVVLPTGDVLDIERGSTHAAANG